MEETIESGQKKICQGCQLPNSHADLSCRISIWFWPTTNLRRYQAQTSLVIGELGPGINNFVYGNLNYLVKKHKQLRVLFSDQGTWHARLSSKLVSRDIAKNITEVQTQDEKELGACQNTLRLAIRDSQVIAVRRDSAGVNSGYAELGMLCQVRVWSGAGRNPYFLATQLLVMRAETGAIAAALAL